jgi:hypothetical protein
MQSPRAGRDKASFNGKFHFVVSRMTHYLKSVTEIVNETT